MALVRKRRLYTDECVSAITITAKKPKNDNTFESTLYCELAGTVTQKEDVTDVIKDISTRSVKANTHTGIKSSSSRSAIKNVHSVTRRTKQRKANQLNVKNKRLEVVNCYRGIFDNISEENKEVTIIDVSDVEVDDSSAEKKDVDTYVYDLFYVSPNEKNFNSLEDIEDYSICAVQDSFESGTFDIDDDDATDVDSGNSNDEADWRNDYPEEYDDFENDFELNTLDSKFVSCDLEDNLSTDEDCDEGSSTFETRYLHFKKHYKDDYYNEVISDHSDNSDSDQ